MGNITGPGDCSNPFASHTLLGHRASMKANTMPEFKAYQVDERTVYAGRTAEEAVAAALADSLFASDRFYAPADCVEISSDYVIPSADPDQATTIGKLLATVTAPGPICEID